MTSLPLDDWLSGTQPHSKHSRFWIYSEREEQRRAIWSALCATVRDHFCDAAVIERLGGYPKALAIVRNRLPSAKKIRSGDFGEILAAEYVHQKTGFRVPLKRLRYKDDRNMPMRGDDVIGIRRKNGRCQVLKAESKSREILDHRTVLAARSALRRYSGRPTPSTLAFISMCLRAEGKDDEAAIVEHLQTNKIVDRDIEHLLFVVTSRSPLTYLRRYATAKVQRILRHAVGVVIQDHQGLIQALFDALDAGHS